MKIIYSFLLFILFCALSFFIENSGKHLNKNSTNKNIIKNIINHSTFNMNDSQVFSNYIINAKLYTKNRTIKVEQFIFWVNRSNYSTDKIYFKLDLNAIKNNYSEFASKNYLKSDEFSEISDLRLYINNKQRKLNFFNNFTSSINDSTTAFINLDTTCLPGDTVKIFSSFVIKVPKPSYSIGYVQNRDFYFINDWFIKIPPFINGKWMAFPTPGYINYFDDFSNFKLSITIPSNFIIGATSKIEDKKRINNYTTYSYNGERIKSFSWFCGPNIIRKDFDYKNGNNKITVTIFVQPEKENRIERYKNIIFKSFHFLENKIGNFKYNTFTLVDLPRTYSNISHSYINLGVIKTNLFIPEKSLEPESEIANIICKQYFENIISTNCIYEPWVSSGLAKYYSSKIIEQNYAEASYSFNIAKYIPIYGLNFISYNEIPLIYSLGEFKYFQNEFYLPMYYKNHSVGSINNNTYEFPTKDSYFVMSTIKPELAFIMLERILGNTEFDRRVKTFYNKYKFKHTQGNSLFEIFTNKNSNLNYIIENIFKKASYFDYRIKYVKRVNKNSYDVYSERLGDGIFYNKVALYTSKDTIFATWDDDNKWKIFRFETKNEVIGAEIDPFKINVMDLNIANNSYLLKPNYIYPFSLTARWFFWIQNALMILGSIV
ncbi:MAG TPA: hypothetical protein PL041_14815 [Melioribacteraceae bacterium]|nr:hypothetical protein [Melioribacteraceae bacterium]